MRSMRKVKSTTLENKNLNKDEVIDLAVERLYDQLKGAKTTMTITTKEEYLTDIITRHGDMTLMILRSQTIH